MRVFFGLLFIFISVYFAFTQESPDPIFETEINYQVPDKEASRTEEFWIGLYTGTAMYSAESFSIGGGLELAYGKGISIGLKAVYFADISSLSDVLEICFLLRFYLFGIQSNSGLFLQANAGQAVFFRRENGPSIPAQWGLVSAGLNAGWRFLLGRSFYLEPVIGGGYPYFWGAGMSTGLKF